MKKYFIIAAAAILAMAACSKTEVDQNSANNKKIGFEVANYAKQATKAQTLTNSEDGIYQFHTIANQHPDLGNPVVFMDTDIFAWKSTTHSDANKIGAGSSDDIVEWAPVADYYWPKTGYINFYSYAGTIAPTVDNTAANKKVVKFTYSNVEISKNSNVLVADAALHYNAVVANTYQVDNGGETTAAKATTGVPTLFRHKLAKLIIDVKAKTTAATNGNIWTVEVLDQYSQSNNTYYSRVTPINKGSLELTHTDSYDGTVNAYPTSSSDASFIAWVPTYNQNTDVSGWRASTTATDVENIALSKDTQEANAPLVDAPKSGVLTIDDGQTESTVATILNSRSVMPQKTSGVTFSLVYRVTAKHTGDQDPYLEEIRTVSGTLGNLLADQLTEWQANKRITYHIIIDPVTTKVTFDPAVEEYDPIAGNSDSTINIDQNGMIQNP